MADPSHSRLSAGDIVINLLVGCQAYTLLSYPDSIATI